MNSYHITGAGRGLGRALAMALLREEENRVIGIGRTCTITHDHYQHIVLDLGAPDAVGDFRFRFPKGTQRAVLINNAGVVRPVAPVGKIKVQSLVTGFTVNLISPAILMNQFVRDTGNKSAERTILNISSGAARHPVDSWSCYCAAKAGLDMFSNVLHDEQVIYHGKKPVRVFSVAPGVVDTDMQKEIRSIPKSMFAGKDRFVEMKKNGKLASAEAVAEVLLRIVHLPANYPQVCLDVRDLTG